MENATAGCESLPAVESCKRPFTVDAAAGGCSPLRSPTDRQRRPPSKGTSPFARLPSISVFHTAIIDPTAAPDEPERESIDTRLLLREQCTHAIELRLCRVVCGRWTCQEEEQHARCAAPIPLSVIKRVQFEKQKTPGVQVEEITKKYMNFISVIDSVDRRIF